MSTRPIREQIDTGLTPPLNDGEFELLKDKGLIEDYEVREATLTEIREEVRSWRQAVGGESPTQKRRPSSRKRGVAYFADDLLQQDPRARAISEIAAHHAASRHEVQDFRRTVLKGRLLTTEQARLWIKKKQADKQNRRPTAPPDDWFTLGLLVGEGREEPLTDWDQFFDVVTTLTLWYPWQAPPASYFLLTGQTPPVRPILGGVHPRSELPVL